MTFMKKISDKWLAEQFNQFFVFVSTVENAFWSTYVAG